MGIVGFALFIVCFLLLRSAKKENAQLAKRIDDLDIETIEESLQKIQETNDEIAEVSAQRKTETALYHEITEKKEKADKKLQRLLKNMEKAQRYYSAMVNATEHFNDEVLSPDSFLPLSEEELVDALSLYPTATLDLQSLNYKDLRKKFRENERLIQKLVEKSRARYKTKSNQALYQSMVLALSAELQNILIKLHYGTIDKAKDEVHQLTNKYLAIAAEGNQSIVSTLKKFVYQLEDLYCHAVDIEYLYYLRREQAKEEQKKIREQLREEKAEKKKLEAQQKKMEEEKEKYSAEMKRLLEAKSAKTGDEDTSDIDESIQKLQTQLDTLKDKQEEIVTLMNGKAGSVYVISNIGSFGENVFKIGMTRRLEPQERIDELGGASVPFKFDVHSLIFSEDASKLESEIHQRLDEKRVNKVNKRKEFFHVSLDQLEELVNDIYPSAEFKRTVLAEEYKQSISLKTALADVV